jgi:hypothetical protein
MLKTAQKTNIDVKYLFKKISFLNKYLSKNKNIQSSQNYDELVNSFIIKVKKNNRN